MRAANYKMTVQVGDYVKASYSFPGEGSSDLSLSIGDIVRVTDVVDGNWAVGNKVGTQSKSGTFPLAFVESLTLPSVRTGQKVLLVIEDFPAEQNGDLELSKGEIIVGLEPVSESWWKGKSGPLKGIFPLTMVAELELHDGLSSRSASACSSGMKLRSDSICSQSESACMGGLSSGITKVTEITFARALVDVTPQLDGELAFQLGDLIEITEILDDDWFYGKCHNKEGLVSAVCVEILIESGEVNDYSENKLPHCSSGNSSSTLSSGQEPRKGSESQNVESVESRTGSALKGSYTSENTRSHDTEVTPYGRVIYPFIAQIPTELSLEENNLVTLIQHVDTDWTEGEVNGKRGLFPTSFIEIIVDCLYAYDQDVKEKQPFLEVSLEIDNAENAAVKTTSNNNTAAAASTGLNVNENGSKPRPNLESKEEIRSSVNTVSINSGTDESEENHEIGLVLYNFVAEVAGDISVTEGDTVEVVTSLDENWLKIKTEDGKAGQVPKNYVEIIGPWPKVKSDSTELNNSSSFRNAFIQTFKGQSRSGSSKENIKVQSSVTSVPAINRSSAGQSSSEDTRCIRVSAPSTTEYLTPIHKPVLPSKGKPPLLPKPSLSPKPIIASKPTSVITPQSFTPARHGYSAKPKTSLPMLENRANSLSSLDDFIKEEITKAKGDSLSRNSDILINPDRSLQTLSDISANKDPEHNLSNASPVVYRRTYVDNHGSDATYKPTACDVGGFVSLISASTTSTTQSALGPTHVNSERQGNDTRRNIFASSVSFSGENTAVSDATNRRKSDSFAGLMAHDTAGLPAQDSSFVNKAFQMDTDEGILIDLKDKNSSHVRRTPARVAPPRPVSAIVSSTSHSAEIPAGKLRAPPPRPTGPRMASAPSKTPLMPIRAEPPAKLVPKRSAPRAPGTYNQNINASLQSAHNSTPPRSRRHPPRPSSFPAPPRRPPPRPADLMSFSPEGAGVDMSEEDTKDLVADLKSKLEENRADIKKFEQTQTDLRKNLAQANSLEKEAETKDNLEFVERQLFGLQEEEGRLKENLFALSPHEARLEKARILAAQHAQEEMKRKEEEKKKEAEMKEKRKDQRGQVLREILGTEKDFLLSLQLCLETFLDGQKVPAGVDLNFLLGNMEEIADVSQKMVVHLETCTAGKSFEDQHVGKCFIHFAEDMKNTYAPYCRNHDGVITAMERYTESTEINDYLNAKIEKMREQMNVFDVAGVLIKPVQRILKYPLLLNELLKNTDEDHADREDIVTAINAMTDVAKAINEYKRRKDLVYKYKKLTDQTFSDKISKLNLHSIRKKSTRIKGRLSTNFGIGLQMRDEKFEKAEAKFRHLERAVKIFLRSVIQFSDQIQETMQCQESVVDGIQDFYSSKGCEEVTKLHEVTVKLLKLFDQMKETVESVVVTPLNALVGLFSGPAKIIEKRFDKLLDYNYQMGKTENDKELQAAKNDYEAMNAQLLDELPKFYSLAFLTLNHCIAVFIIARRDFVNQSLKEGCALLVLPSMVSRASLMETFKMRHMTVFDHLSLLSFIPKGFNPKVDTIKADRAKQKGRAVTESSSHQQNISLSSQSESQKANLQQKYPASKLYTVISAFTAVDPTDISLTEGSLVGVIKELDPMGNKDKWYLDDGAIKGFAPSNILVPLGSQPPENVIKVVVEEDLISILSGDSGDLIFIGNDDRVEYHVNDTSAESGSQSQHQQDEPQCYYALYNFISRNPNETSLVAGHPVTVLSFHDLDGNSEWWLVESEGNCGYAPANYMAPMLCS